MEEFQKWYDDNYFLFRHSVSEAAWALWLAARRSVLASDYDALARRLQEAERERDHERELRRAAQDLGQRHCDRRAEAERLLLLQYDDCRNTPWDRETAAFLAGAPSDVPGKGQPANVPSGGRAGDRSAERKEPK